MPGENKTKVMMVRLPLDVAAKVKERARRRDMSESEYMRRILVQQVNK